MEAISKIRVIPYQLKFKTPLHTSEGILNTREGIVVNFISKNISAFGEIAPLPGYSHESFSQINTALKELLPLFKATPSQAKALLKELPANLPSLCFGLESVVFDFLAKQSALSLAEFLNPRASSEVDLNSVVFPGMNLSKNIGSITANKASKTVKIKVSPTNLQTVLELLNDLPKNLKVRLDANQTFNSSNIQNLFSKLNPKQIDYVEEPLIKTQLEGLEGLTQNYSIPIALDESLYQCPEALSETLSSNNNFHVAVLKPSMLGGINLLKNVIDACYKRQLRVVLTSSLESVVAVSTQMHLARALLTTPEACGFDTLDLFEEVKTKIPSKGKGIGDFSELPGVELDQTYEL